MADLHWITSFAETNTRIATRMMYQNSCFWILDYRGWMDWKFFSRFVEIDKLVPCPFSCSQVQMKNISWKAISPERTPTWKNLLTSLACVKCWNGWVYIFLSWTNSWLNKTFP